VGAGSAELQLGISRASSFSAELELGVPGIVGTECGRVESGNNVWIVMKTSLQAPHKIFYRFDT